MSRIVHQIANCQNCDKIWDDYNGNARRKGYNHAKSTGHKVTWETGIAGVYYYPKNKN